MNKQISSISPKLSCAPPSRHIFILSPDRRDRERKEKMIRYKLEEREKKKGKERINYT